MSARRRWIPALAVALLGALAAGLVLYQRATRPVTLTLRFHAMAGDAPLALGSGRYANPGGAGTFSVRDFQFFLSNIRLLGQDAEWAEADSYHLLRFDGPEPVFELVLRELPRVDWQRIRFGIGVDPAANASIQPRGELDPNGRMAWSWEVGYKFVLVEGMLEDGERHVPLVYHVGFDSSYAEVALDLPPQGDFAVDLLQLFAGSPPLDLAALPTVKFDRADTARLAVNFPALIRPLAASPNPTLPAPER